MSINGTRLPASGGDRTEKDGFARIRNKKYITRRDKEMQ